MGEFDGVMEGLGKEANTGEVRGSKTSHPG